MKQSKLFITGIIFFVFGIVLSAIPMALSEWCDPIGFILPLCFAILGAVFMIVESISEKVTEKKNSKSQDNAKER